MNKNFIYTLNNILLAFVFPLLLFSFKNYIIIFVAAELIMLMLIKDKLFTFFKVLFVTSFIALFIIHNPRFYFGEISWGFINEFWIRILYLFLFVSWMALTISITNLVAFMKYLKISSEFVFLVTTTFVLLKRIPVKLRQIYEVQKARRILGNSIRQKILTYPQIIVPLITTLLRELDYFVFNYYLLDKYKLKEVKINNKIMRSGLTTIFHVLVIIGLITKNVW